MTPAPADPEGDDVASNLARAMSLEEGNKAPEKLENGPGTTKVFGGDGPGEGGGDPMETDEADATTGIAAPPCPMSEVSCFCFPQTILRRRCLMMPAHLHRCWSALHPPPLQSPHFHQQMCLLSHLLRPLLIAGDSSRGFNRLDKVLSSTQAQT